MVKSPKYLSALSLRDACRGKRILLSQVDIVEFLIVFFTTSSAMSLMTPNSLTAGIITLSPLPISKKI